VSDTVPSVSVAPTIPINGANPGQINVGDTYADLGATITGPQTDLNLGIHLYIDGRAVDAVQLDTTNSAIHQVDYVVTDENGLTSTTTRTVIVSAVAANDNSPAATSTPASANDNSPVVPLAATGTNATSTAQ
jgi:surface protein with Ig-like domain